MLGRLGMLCVLCWIDVPCKTFTRQSLANHAKHVFHVTAIGMEGDLSSSWMKGRIAMAVEIFLLRERPFLDICV